MADDTLIAVDGVHKKFCRNLKSSLVYGVRDIISDLNPFTSGRSNGGATAHLREGEFWAVKEVSFELRRGECLALIGHNGAGKTTLLKMLNGLIKPDAGSISIRGRVGALIALGAGFNPILTGRENIYVNGSVLGLSRAEIEERLEEIIDFSELRDFIDTPVQSYSSGMQVRLGFAVATALKPDVLLLDEVLAVGDVAFRGKCFKRIGEVLSNAAVIFVSHSEPQIRRICNRALMMESGSMFFSGDTSSALRTYRNRQPRQTRGLRLIKERCVTEFEAGEVPAVVDWGGEISLAITLALDEPVAPAHLLVHFGKDGDLISHAEMRFDGAQEMRLEPGRHRFRLRIGPLHLVHGKYDLSLSIFIDSGKRTLLQAFDFKSIEIVGPVGAGPANLVPLAIEVAEASGTATLSTYEQSTAKSI